VNAIPKENSAEEHDTDEPVEIPRRVMFGPVKPGPWGPIIWIASHGVSFLIPLLAGGGGSPLAFVSYFAIGLFVGFINLFIFSQVAIMVALGMARSGNAERALKWLNIFTHINGSVVPFIMTRANILYGCHQPEGARDYLRAKWDDVPTSAHLHAKACLGTTLVLLEQDLEEAKGLLSEVLAQRPEWIDTHLALGMAYYLLEGWKEAAEHLLKASQQIELQDNVRQETLFFALGDALVKSGRGKDAKPWFEKSRAVVDAKLEKKTRPAAD
jgi:tetratricopeptide (TPR) repeat protein